MRAIRHASTALKTLKVEELLKVVEEHPSDVLGAVKSTFQKDSLAEFSLRDLNTAISACGKANRWQEACLLLASSLSKDVVSYNATMNSCEKARQWQLALRLFRELSAVGLVPDEASFASGLAAYGAGGCWLEALGLLERISLARLTPNVACFKGLLSACEKAAQWAETLDLWERMLKDQVEPTARCYGAAMRAAEKSQQWRWAVQLLDGMPQTWSWSLTLGLCGQLGEWHAVLELFHSMQQRQVKVSGPALDAVLSCCSKVGAWNTALLAVEAGGKRHGEAMASCVANWPWALELWRRMEAEPFEPSRASYNGVFEGLRHSAEALETWKLELLHSRVLDVLGVDLKDPRRLDVGDLSVGAALLVVRSWLNGAVQKELSARRRSFRCSVGFRERLLRQEVLSMLRERHLWVNVGRDLELDLSRKDLSALRCFKSLRQAGPSSKTRRRPRPAWQGATWHPWRRSAWSWPMACRWEPWISGL